MNPFTNLAAVLNAAVPAQTPSATKVTGEQIALITKLLRKTENRDSEIKAELEHLERELVDAYAGFELDETGIQQLQSRTAAAQLRLLANYHELQVGIREIMGPAKFLKIKERIDLHLKKMERLRRQGVTPDTEAATN